MKLSNARLCLDCDEVYDEAQCPACASESFAFIKRWVSAQEKRPGASVPNHNQTRAETVATYRALLATDQRQPTRTTQLLRGGLVGLAVIGAAGWVLRRSLREKKEDKEKKDDGEPTSAPL